MRNALISVLLSMAVFACASGREQIIAQDGGSFVRIEHDPTAPRTGNTHPVLVSPERLQALLAAIMVQSPSGALLGKQQTLALFDPEDLTFLAPALSDALAAAKPSERAVFYLEQRGRLLRGEVTTGAVIMKGDVLMFTLGHYRRTDVTGVVQNDRQSANSSEVRSDPMFGVYGVNTRISALGAASGGPRTIQFGMTGTLPPATVAASGTAAQLPPPPRRSFGTQEHRAASAPATAAGQDVSLEDLRREIKELTMSNQELRAKVRDLSDQLAETKQLLGDKVLELDRLNKSSAVPRRPKAPSGR
jgi:hypothetical protein